MTVLDWAVVLLYIAGIIWLGFSIGRKQEDQQDYYLAGRAMKPWQVAFSIMSTQVSAISLIGAPAFVALKEGGGLSWLQYELAVPLAMALLLAYFLPPLFRSGGITVYEFLEEKFGRSVRQSISFIFLISRGLGTGVALLAASVVTAVCLGLPLKTTVLITGVVTIIYTTMGGIKADIYSDIIQLFIFVAGTLFSIVFLALYLAKEGVAVTFPDPSRLQVFRLSETGFDGSTFAFWPMVLGGLFLYMSYYGCDQSQAQRLLTTPDLASSQKALLLNGLLRFPITLTYIIFGLLLIPFLSAHKEFAAAMQGQPYDFLVPEFIMRFFPAGLRGIMVAGIFAATMSSVDSALNSLSAATWRDFLLPMGRRFRLGKSEVLPLRILTLGWGAFSMAAAFVFMGGPETVIELVNKIGSAFYGPILAVFLLAVGVRGPGAGQVLAGLFAGVGLNIFLWLAFPQKVSWMWWNLIGFAATLLLSYLLSLFSSKKVKLSFVKPSEKARLYMGLLFAAFPAFILICWALEKLLQKL